MIQSPKFYLLETVCDVEPVLHGPFETRTCRDAAARQLREADPAGRNGLLPMDARLLAGEMVLTAGAYSGAFFEEGVEACREALQMVDADSTKAGAWPNCFTGKTIEAVCAALEGLPGKEGK